MARNIGATLSLKAGNFFANMKAAVTATNNLNGALNNTSKGISSFSSKLSGVSSAAGKMAKGVGVAMGAAATAVTALVGGSVNAFADYEQLVGGIDTLFKGASSKLQGYAAEAYKTVGMSANRYMETVTSFSASLISSLGGDTEKAADYANTAMTDISDNANKMGTSLESLSDTYKSLARGNFAMLDNLKLGYGGTKAEMERLLSDAEKLRAEMGKPVKYDISSFSDIISAIHDIQGSMDITGTTAKEAATTISGSFNAMKSAWENTVTALAIGGEPLNKSIDELVASAKTYIGNIIPAVSKALGGVGQLVSGLAPVLIAELPGLVSTVLPPLVSAAGTLVTGVVSQIPTIVSAVIDNVPTLIQSTIGAIDPSAAEGLITAFNNVKTAITDAFSGNGHCAYTDAYKHRDTRSVRCAVNGDEHICRADSCGRHAVSCAFGHRRSGDGIQGGCYSGEHRGAGTKRAYCVLGSYDRHASGILWSIDYRDHSADSRNTGS